MRRRRRAKLIGTGVLAALVALAGAIALAQPGPETPETCQEAAGRASRAAQALSDAYPGNRAVALLADVAQDEIRRAACENKDELLVGFSARAEEHLIANNRGPTEARQILANLVQQLRGEGGSAAASPAEPAAEPGQLNAVGQDLVVEAGRTVEQASVVWGDLIIRGHVLGDAVAVGGDVRLEPGGRVDGDAVSVGGEVQVAEGAWVAGERSSVGRSSISSGMPAASGSGLLAKIKGFFDRLIIAIVLGLLAIITAALFPARVRTVIATLKHRPGMSLLSGLLSLLVTVIAIALLTITCIGAPVAAVLAILVGFAALLGMTGVATLLGEKLPGKMKDQRTAMRCLGIGIVVLAVVSLIPLGGLVIFLALAFAMGAVVLSRLGGSAPHR